MEITLKNGMTISERELRFYFEAPIPLLEKLFRKIKREIKFSSWKADCAFQLAAIKKEIELKNHKDYKEYNKAWLIVHKKRVQKWNQENETKNFWIDKEIKKLEAEKKQPIKI